MKTKIRLGAKSSKKCPECDSDTVVETITDVFGKRKVRRCDGLIDMHHDKPLEACMWSEEIYDNGKVKI